MVVHQRRCDGKVQFDYVGGSFRNHDTVWDRVANAGVDVEDAARFHEFFIVVDGENVLKGIGEEKKTERWNGLRWIKTEMRWRNK